MAIQPSQSSQYDPTAALPPKLVTKILNLEFVETRELLPDAWQDIPHRASELVGQQCHTRRPPVTDIITWPECFGCIAVVLCTKYPEKASEIWAYQTSILRVAKRFEALSWVAYDCQYRRESLAQRSLNWSVLHLHFYSEAFTGRANAIPCCQHCLSEAHSSTACPTNPGILYQHPAHPLLLAGPSLTHPRLQGSKYEEICTSYNEGKCKFSYCKYHRMCKDCFLPHPWGSAIKASPLFPKATIQLWDTSMNEQDWRTRHRYDRQVNCTY